MNNINSRALFILLVFTAASCILPSSLWAQATLDDVRNDILKESIEEIRSVNEELKRVREKETKEEKEKKKSIYEKKIMRARRLESIKKQYMIIDQSNELLKAIEEYTPVQSDKRLRYQELLDLYAERPIESMPIEEQEQTANKLLAQATARLVEILKKQSLEMAKKKRGEEYEDVEVSSDYLVELNQYTLLVKHIEESKVAQEEKITTKKELVINSTKELIDFLKKEAIRRAKQKELAKKDKEDKKYNFKEFDGTVGIHYGYDNNVNADVSFEGGLFVRNYMALNWLPSLNKFIAGNVGIWYLRDNYVDDQDVTFQMSAGNASFQWNPFGNNTLEIKPGYEWIDTHYPNNESLATKENKLFLNTKYTFWNNWYQELNYENLRTHYNNNRLARDGNGDNLIDSHLRKRRHSIEHILKFPFFYNSSFKLKQNGQKQTSNDAFTDFYDYYSYKVTTEIGKSLTDKIYGKASLSYEQKDYSQRTVSDIEVAQEDKTYQQKMTLFYFLNNDWLMNYTWTRTKVDSNSSIYDYEKMTHLIGAYYSF